MTTLSDWGPADDRALDAYLTRDPRADEHDAEEAELEAPDARRGYEAAPATALVATHCCLCGRPLLDAPSVERGVGPTCAARYGYDRAEADPDWPAALACLDGAALPEGALAAWPADARRAVNALVHAIAAKPEADEVPRYVRVVSALGYRKLAERLVERLSEGRAVVVRAEGGELVVEAPYSEAFTAALRSRAPGRRWDRERKAWRVPMGQKRGLWAALCEAFPGAPLVSDRGVSVVG